MKRCLECKSKLKLIRGKRFHYRESGYLNIYLDGVVQYKCHRCGESGAWIPNIHDLETLIVNSMCEEHEAIARDEVNYLDTFNDEICVYIKLFRESHKQKQPMIFRWTGSKWVRSWQSIEIKQYLDLLRRHEDNIYNHSRKG